jgi:hypothetical protein
LAVLVLGHTGVGQNNTDFPGHFPTSNHLPHFQASFLDYCSENLMDTDVGILLSPK